MKGDCVMTMTNQKINPQDLIIPTSWDINVQTEEELIFLGQRNLWMLHLFWTRYMNQRGRSAAETERAKSYRDYISSLIELSEDKPLLASLRKSGQFRVGDFVMVYVCDEEGVIPEKAHTFVQATVAQSGSSDDNYVAVRTNAPFRAGNNACVEVCYLLGPGIMSVWEYKYLQANPDYLEMWLKDAKAAYVSSSEFHRPDFLAAFSTPA